MKDLELRSIGLREIDDYEMEITGGFDYGKIIKWVERAVEILEKAEKYWPSFKEGFNAGWEAVK